MRLPVYKVSIIHMVEFFASLGMISQALRENFSFHKKRNPVKVSLEWYRYSETGATVDGADQPAIY